MTFDDTKKRAYGANEDIYYGLPVDSSHLAHREGVRSTFTVPLSFKRTCVGTLNFESFIENSFEHDLPFFRGFRDAVEACFRAVFDNNDRHMLARRARYEQNVHELWNISESKNTPRRISKEISDLLSSQDLSISQNKAPLNALLQERQKIIDDRRDADRASRLSNCVAVLAEDRMVDEYRLELIRVVYRNFLTNFQNHCIADKDRLEIKSFEGRWPLRIFMKSVRPFLAEEKRVAGVSPMPISDLSNQPSRIRSERIGLMLTGVVVRQLGGFMHVGNARTGGGSIIVATIPLEEKEE